MPVVEAGGQALDHRDQGAEFVQSSVQLGQFAFNRRDVPLESLLVESDAPWRFGGEFEGLASGPWLVSRVAEEVAKLKRLPVDDVMFQLSANTCRLFHLAWR